MSANKTELLKTFIYHITDVENLSSIIRTGGLKSDAHMQNHITPAISIAYPHIKERRLNKYRIACCENKFVGEFVPFYFCPRSPMLYTINNGDTGREKGCQKSILHLVSNIEKCISPNKQWAISDGNAGAAYAMFKSNLNDLDGFLDWSVINSNDWGRQHGEDRCHKKQAEFLVADFLPWQSIAQIGCYDQKTADKVGRLLYDIEHTPKISVNPDWYY